MKHLISATTSKVGPKSHDRDFDSLRPLKQMMWIFDTSPLAFNKLDHTQITSRQDAGPI